MLQKPYVHVIFFLVLWLDLFFVGLDLDFSFMVYEISTDNFRY